MSRVRKIGIIVGVKFVGAALFLAFWKGLNKL